MKSTQILEEIYGRLARHYGPQRWWPGESRLDVEALLRLAPAELAERIRPAGYFNRHVKRLIAFLRFLKENYGGDLGRMAAEPSAKLRSRLLEVKGIGPETADAILLYVLGHPVFVIDVYAYRVFTRHALAPEEAGYEELQEIAGSGPPDLERYREFHALLVRVGQDFCRTKANCEECPLKGVNW